MSFLMYLSFISNKLLFTISNGISTRSVKGYTLYFLSSTEVSSFNLVILYKTLLSGCSQWSGCGVCANAWNRVIHCLCYWVELEFHWRHMDFRFYNDFSLKRLGLLRTIFENLFQGFVLFLLNFCEIYLLNSSCYIYRRLFSWNRDLIILLMDL